MSEPKDTVHFERILNRRVIGRDGKSVGRIEEAIIERDGELREFHLGTSAFFERLAATVVSMFGARIDSKGYAAAWDQIDLSNPKRPRLLCEVSELRRLE